MLMKDDKKKGVTIIMEKLMAGPEKAKPMKTNEVGDEVDDSYGMKAAAEEIMSAVKSENPAALMQALKAFMDMYEAEEDMEEEESYAPEDMK